MSATEIITETPETTPAAPPVTAGSPEEFRSVVESVGAVVEYRRRILTTYLMRLLREEGILPDFPWPRFLADPDEYTEQDWEAFAAENSRQWNLFDRAVAVLTDRLEVGRGGVGRGRYLFAAVKYGEGARPDETYGDCVGIA
jgi:hypothetical protein